MFAEAKKWRVWSTTPDDTKKSKIIEKYLFSVILGGFSCGDVVILEDFHCFPIVNHIGFTIGKQWKSLRVHLFECVSISMISYTLTWHFLRVSLTIVVLKPPKMKRFSFFTMQLYLKKIITPIFLYFFLTLKKNRVLGNIGFQ